MSAKVVSLINMKGGVGKTTLAVGLAWELAKEYDVLLVDIDPQFNATQWVIETQTYLDWVKTSHTVLNIFVPDGHGVQGLAVPNTAPPPKVTAKTTIVTVEGNGCSLDIVPSILDLIRLDAAPRGTENRLRVFLEKVKDKYDYVLIDCPPTASLFSYSAFLASDAYLVPVKPDPLSVLGLPLLERAMTEYEERSGHNLPRLGLVLTQVRGTDSMTATSNQLKVNYLGEVFDEHIPLTTGVAEAVEDNSPLQEFAKTKYKLKDHLAGLASEFVKRAEEL
ncbi:ParA family protein [Bordetella petrii]|uniref:ParA family protein n=1 Tax=Bordetella petrii TaxID=94624 RepID=UPI001A97C60C|nr:ParA family protein [Bordetella petrii]MBO1111551.1 ParA family protein [Bordetella petrii]